MKFLIMQFLQPPIISSLYGPNILLSTLFSNMINIPLKSEVRYLTHIQLQRR
jgi:hypothetical protein